MVGVQYTIINPKKRWERTGSGGIQFDIVYYCYYNNCMKWDESKRIQNLMKHGLDFKNAGQVLDSPFRLDVETVRNNERRMQSFAYVFERLSVLTVVHSGNAGRVISFRKAGREEREVYHDWLEKEFK